MAHRGSNASGLQHILEAAVERKPAFFWSLAFCGLMSCVPCWSMLYQLSLQEDITYYYTILLLNPPGSNTEPNNNRARFKRRACKGSSATFTCVSESFDATLIMYSSPDRWRRQKPVAIHFSLVPKKTCVLQLFWCFPNNPIFRYLKSNPGWKIESKDRTVPVGKMSKSS